VTVRESRATHRNARKSEGGALHVEVDDDVDGERRPGGRGHVAVVRAGARVLEQVLADPGLLSKTQRRNGLEGLGSIL
jgi:hypothetical protein